MHIVSLLPCLIESLKIQKFSLRKLNFSSFLSNCSRNKECKLPDPGNVLIFKAFSLGNLKNIKLENKKGLSEYSTDTQI